MSHATYVQGSDVFDYTPTVDVAAGTVVVVNDLLAIAVRDIKANKLGALVAEGTFDVVKDSATVIALGASIYWDVANSKAVTVASGNRYMGKAVLAGVAGQTSVRVRVST
jgi:predicted RecA/RadA family phage recombinase